MNVLPTLHLAALNHNPLMRVATRHDWLKVKKWLEGTWPKAIPERLVVNGNSTTMDFDRLWLMDPPDTICIDTEFNNETLTLLGVGWDGGGFQIGMPWVVTRRAEVASILQSLVSSRRTIFQNSLADIPVIERMYGFGHGYYERIEDTMLAHAVLWSEWPHDLEFLASIYGCYPKLKHLSQIDPYLYNWGDVIDTLEVWRGLEQEFRFDPQSEHIYREQSLALVPILLHAKSVGIRVNKQRVEMAGPELLAQVRDAAELAQAYVGWDINVGSDDQLKHVLYDEDRLPPQHPKDDKTKLTVDKDAIAALRQHVGVAPDPDVELTIESIYERIDQGAHPLLECRVLYSHAQHTYSHYIKPGLTRDRFYPDILIHAQETGRWSINDPPLAQLPERLRDIIIPDPGTEWVQWDWEQIELRLLAVLCGDKKLIEAFKNGWDVHTLNTCDIFGYEYPPDKVDPHNSEVCREWRERYRWTGSSDIRRKFSKTFEYRLNYGGDPRHAGDIPGAKVLGLDGPQLVKAANMLLDAHPEKKAWRQQLEADVRQSKVYESRTFMGRRRRFLASARTDKVLREAYNNPMQAGVADILNTTVIECARQVPEAVLVYTAHDSVTFAVPESITKHALYVMKNIAERAFQVGPHRMCFPAKFKVINAA